VRISIRAQELLIEPFLIVGLIASIRRVLAITMQAATMMQQNHVPPDAQAAFQNSMIELALLGGLVLVFVVSIFVSRRSHHEKVVQK
jgi:hypothetical protein